MLLSVDERMKILKNKDNHLKSRVLSEASLMTRKGKTKGYRKCIHKF